MLTTNQGRAPARCGASNVDQRQLSSVGGRAARAGATDAPRPARGRPRRAWCPRTASGTHPAARRSAQPRTPWTTATARCCPQRWQQRQEQPGCEGARRWCCRYLRLSSLTRPSPGHCCRPAHPPAASAVRQPERPAQPLLHRPFRLCQQQRERPARPRPRLPLLGTSPERPPQQPARWRRCHHAPRLQAAAAPPLTMPRSRASRCC